MTLRKYPKIKRLGHRATNGILDDGELYIQEKLDGANFRFGLADDGETILYGSRNHVFDGPDDENIPKMFRETVDYVEETVDRDALADLEEERGPLTFFGEAMIEHTLEYDWDLAPQFLGFDVWSESRDEFLIPNEMEVAYSRLGLETAPVLDTYKNAHQFSIEEYDIPETQYGDVTAEGIVIKNTDLGLRAKYRSEEFLEAHESAKRSHDPKDTEFDHYHLATKFTTKARVRKQIQKLEQEGWDLEMAMMEELWERVYDDIIEEEYETVFHGNYQLKTKEFRSRVANRTASILEKEIARQASDDNNSTTVTA